MPNNRRFGILLVGDVFDELMQVSMALNAKDQFTVYPAVIDKLPGYSDAEIALYATRNGFDKSVGGCSLIAQKYGKPVILLSAQPPPPSSGIQYFKYDCPLPLSYQAADNLALKIRVVFSHAVTSSMSSGKHTTPDLNPEEIDTKADEDIHRFLKGNHPRINLICIGASAGGTEATHSVLKQIPETLPPIVIVQHIPAVFSEMYAHRLDTSCRVSVSEAISGQLLKRGSAYVAPGGFQFRVKKGTDGYFAEIGNDSKVSGHCPSVDVMFESVSQSAGSGALGVILTGMGSDGAKGLLKLRGTGAVTIGQDESSCLVYGMPKAAYDAGAVSIQLPLSKIHKLITALSA